MIIDLRKIKKENVSNIVKAVLFACNAIESIGKTTSIKVEKKKKKVNLT